MSKLKSIYRNSAARRHRKAYSRAVKAMERLRVNGLLSEAEFIAVLKTATTLYTREAVSEQIQDLKTKIAEQTKEFAH